MASKITAAGTRSLASDVAGLLKIPPNKFRIGIIISVPAAGVAFVQIGSSDGLSGGIQINASLPYLELTADRYGSAVAEGISVQNSAGVAMTFGVSEFVEAP